MTLTGTPFPTALHIDGCGDYGYIDVDVYVVVPDGREWKFQRSYDMQGKYFYDGYVQFSPDQEACFDEYEGEVPQAVKACYETAKPHAHRMIADAFLKRKST